MPIQYRLADEDGDLSGGFFRTLVLPDGKAWVGGLMLIDARGEPLEFTYSRVDLGHRFLWREDALRRATARELAASVLEACPRTPSALFCLAKEVDAELFTQDLDVHRPLARIAPAEDVVGAATDEEHETVSARETVQLLWVHGRPSEATEAHRLVERLAARSLLLEPFERVLVGLREVYELSGDGDAEPA